MGVIIADTLTDSLTRLSADEQKAVKTTVYDLHVNPANPSLHLHKLDRAKDRNFWSVRVSGDIRIITHKTENSFLLCYVDHHDKAYSWAERRKLETHPRTGAAQLVEIRETVKEVIVPVYVEQEVASAPQPPLFVDVSDDVLLSYGVPPEWLDDVKAVNNEDKLLELTDHLPSEASEALIELATGGTPQPSEPVVDDTDPFAHPDAQRRFRVMSNLDELKRALEYPWDKWTIFLHPAQRKTVEADFNGPARVSGSAGTGKTIVALHRAVFLARQHPDARVLLTTFSETLANALRTKLRRLISHEPHLAERLEVYAIEAIGHRLYKANVGEIQNPTKEILCALMETASSDVGDHKFRINFLMSEWEQVVDAWQLETWDDYRDVARLGRKTRISEQQRTKLWEIFERVRAGMKERSLVTRASLFNRLTTVFSKLQRPPFDFIVVDEAQDISVSQLRFLAAIGGQKPNALFFAGDLGQRIFQQPFSWKALGVDIRGRSRTLRVNYRTSHQIRQQADRLLASQVSDVDGNTEQRDDTVSVFNGPPPTIRTFGSEAEEINAVADWLNERASEGVEPHECSIFVRSEAQIDRARDVLSKAGMTYEVLDENVETTSGDVSICTMHIAKGLEFRAVVVMACDDEVIPLQERIGAIGDEADLRDVYETERHLLYVACTRARDNLLVTSVEPASEFLDDLRS